MSGKRIPLSDKKKVETAALAVARRPQALRDDTKNGCVADYFTLAEVSEKVKHSTSGI